MNVSVRLSLLTVGAPRFLRFGERSGHAPSVDLHGGRLGAKRDNPQNALTLFAAYRFRAPGFMRGLASGLFGTASAATTSADHVFLFRWAAAGAKVLVRVSHGVVRNGRFLAQHLVHRGVKVVHPSGQRVAILEHIHTILCARQVRSQVIAALSTRKDMTERIEVLLVLLFVFGCWVARVVQRYRVQRHPQAGPPHIGHEPVACLQIFFGEGRGCLFHGERRRRSGLVAPCRTTRLGRMRPTPQRF
jgi:hypothetical protein